MQHMWHFLRRSCKNLGERLLIIQKQYPHNKFTIRQRIKCCNLAIWLGGYSNRTLNSVRWCISHPQKISNIVKDQTAFKKHRQLLSKMYERMTTPLIFSQKRMILPCESEISIFYLSMSYNHYSEAGLDKQAARYFECMGAFR